MRHRALSWVVAAGVAVTVGSAHSSARHARDTWGATVDVVVATRDLRAGDLVDRGSARVESRPTVLVPSGALDDVPLGRRVAVAVPAGEVLLSARLAGANRGAHSAALGDGRGLVSLPRTAAGGLPGPSVGPGDLMDLYSAGPDALGARGSVAVARRAEVRHVDDTAVTVEVDLTDAAAVTDALANGRLVTVVVG